MQWRVSVPLKQGESWYLVHAEGLTAGQSQPYPRHAVRAATKEAELVTAAIVVLSETGKEAGGGARVQK